MYDFLIIGCGFSGAVLAERLSSQLDKKVLIVEKRNHIAGNAYDFYNDDGIFIHKHGPHIFHTNYDDVWQYLSRFTRWNGYQHKVLAYVDNKKVCIPINLNTAGALLDTDFSGEGLRDYFDSVKLSLSSIDNARDVVVSQVGEFFYEKIFKNYTYKQWGLYPDKLSPEVTKRIPVRFNTDDRYFSDKYQGIPLEGYSKLFENLLFNSNVTIVLDTDYKEIINDIKFDRLVYTGPIDYFFDCEYGKLPYRSLRFECETFEREYFQEVGVVNYPNDYAFTRISEYKHMTLQKHPKTTIMREYAFDHGEPY